METIIQKRPEPEAPKPDPVPPVPPPPTEPVEPLPPAGPKNNTLATVSMVLGILGLLSLCVTGLTYLIPFAGWLCGCFTLVFGIAALVTGIIARNQIKVSGEGGAGMATAGMVMGGIQLVLVLCGVIVIVCIALFGPAIGNIFSSMNSSLK